ncbi:MAG TPA: hypothetical protein VMG30_20130 [Acidobacteriota bacterium]|nr:hypothetical protein [Acidobacteriota bacterium]
MCLARSKWMLVASVLFLPAIPPSVSSGRNLAYCQEAVTQPEQTFTEEEMQQFLLTAKVTAFKQSSKGITHPYRLTLSDGRVTHDGSFQSVDDRRNSVILDDGSMQINFRDSYHFNIAAYEIAKLVGLGRMMPVTVERKWEGKTGSLTWWLKVKMDEKERRDKKIHPPDPEAWNRQMYRKRIFANLVGDTDPNLTNVLIDENWVIYMIDFSRAFRQTDDVDPTDLIRCDRQLLEKMRNLKEDDVKRTVGNHLTKPEINAVMKRRDKIVAYFEQMIKQKGESEALY